ncbi:MAG: IS110 family transposase [Pseudomonadota bacterium]
MTLPAFYVGCDVSKNVIDFYDASTGRFDTIDNTNKALMRFLKRFKDGGAIIAFEATGAYGDTLRRCLQRAQVSALQINPLRARRFAQSRGKHAKTDRIDARLLADMAERYELQPNTQYCEHQEKLKALIVRRDQLVEQRASELKRLKQCHDPRVAKSLRSAIERLGREIAAFERMIDTALTETPAFADKADLLTTIPGVGKAVAAVLVALLPEAGHTNRRAIAALTGLAPYSADSGQKKGYRAIAEGRGRVRRALYMAALASIRTQSRFAQTYRHLIAKGKAPKLALIAVARKIAVTLNAMLKANKPFK